MKKHIDPAAAIISRCAALAHCVTDAKRRAKEAGVSQVATAREYQRIEAVRAERRRTRADIDSRYCAPYRLSPFNASHRKISRDRQSVLHHLFCGVTWSTPAWSYGRDALAIRIMEATVAANRNASIGNTQIGKTLSVSFRDEQQGYYKGRWSGRRKYVRYVDVTLPENWLRLGLRLSDIDGINTLMPRRPQHIVDGVIEIRRAWILNSKGAKPCVLAMQTMPSGELLAYHGETVKKSVQGLRRKVRRFYGNELPAVITPETPITRAIYARLTGACSAGIAAFCEEHGLIGTRSVRAADLLDMMPSGTWGREKLAAAIAATN